MKMSSTDQTSKENGAASSKSDEEELKLAVAISLLRSKILQQKQPQPPSDSDSESLRWKLKAKERKQEILRLREDLKQAEDASQCDVFPKTALCKCYFFDNLGKLNPNEDSTVTATATDEEGFEHKFNDVLRRRFLRQVRFRERKRKRKIDSSNSQRPFLDLDAEEAMQHLSSSVDFLVELCDTASISEEADFANWSHQAVDFILASLKDLMSIGKSMELVEGIVSGLITRLVRRICSPSHGDSLQIVTDAQFQVQHLIRKLGSESYIGQRAILAISQRICIIGEHMLTLDPFDDDFPILHECLYIMIQLIEFLISDYLLSWSRNEAFESALFEQWVISILHAREALEFMEDRNGLYILYMDRVVDGLAKLVSQDSSLQKLDKDVFQKLFR